MLIAVPNDVFTMDDCAEDELDSISTLTFMEKDIRFSPVCARRLAD
jgi:hypothetical protein